MNRDLEIANSVKLKPIAEIAQKIGINGDNLIPYGKHMAKVLPKDDKKAKLILVTALTPTPPGEGKTTVSIGLADGLNLIGKKTALALREPSLGPVFGIKGGAAGGGYSQVAPMADINLHFTGDFHAITTANNYLSAIIDNHRYWEPSVPRLIKVFWKRAMDLNDRSLRRVVTGLGYENIREDSFDITAASEVMAILALAKDMEDLKRRLENIFVGLDVNNNLVYCFRMRAYHAMAILLKDAINPNLVQTLGGTPAFIHAGPFANIAHGCNSVIATTTAMSYADYVVTEAGFGADLGAEKFIDIKCRAAGIAPNAVVIVATIRALKYAGGGSEWDRDRLTWPNSQALRNGLPNLFKHIENIKDVFGLPCIVAINRFATDPDNEIAIIKSECHRMGVEAVVANVWAKGGEGGVELAEAVAKLCETESTMKFAYDLSDTPQEKIIKVATKIYGAKDVVFRPAALKALKMVRGTRFREYPVCIAKTQYSLSDNPKLLGRPEGFTITIDDIQLKGGAEFLVAIAGGIMLMPGLPQVSAGQKMTIEADGEIRGLF